MDLFLGGVGKGKRTRQGKDCRALFAGDARVQTAPLFVILYVEQWRFRCTMRQTVANEVPDPRCPGADTCAVRASTTRRPGSRIETVKGLLLLVPPRTPRSSGYDVYAHAVYVVKCYMSITCICLLYVVICYMSVICYISVICLVLGPSCYMYISVMCCYMLYVCDMLYVCYMSSARGGG